MSRIQKKNTKPSEKNGYLFGLLFARMFFGTCSIAKSEVKVVDIVI